MKNKKLIILIAFCILSFFICNIPYKQIIYYDDNNKSGTSVKIDANSTFEFAYLYNERINIAYQDGLWQDSLLTRIVLMREDIIQPVIIKKCTVVLYDDKGNIIPFKRIDWYKGGAIADKNMIHYKGESELLKENSKMYGEDIYYIFDELDNDKLRMDYHFIFEIKVTLK